MELVVQDHLELVSGLLSPIVPVGVAEPELQALDRRDVPGEVEIQLPLVRLTASRRGSHEIGAPSVREAREQAGKLEGKERPAEVVPESDAPSLLAGVV